CMVLPYLRTRATARVPGYGRNDAMRTWMLGGGSGLVATAVGFAAACVPNGPASSSDAGPGLAPRARASIAQASPPSPLAKSSTNSPAPSPPLVGSFEDDFERAVLGPDWITTGAKWHIEGGRLCVQGAHNHGAWLARTLPTNARIEFDAVSSSPEGD